MPPQSRYDTFTNDRLPPSDDDDAAATVRTLAWQRPRETQTYRFDPRDLGPIVLFLTPFIIGCDQAAKKNHEGAVFGFSFAALVLMAIIGATIEERKHRRPPTELVNMTTDDSSDDDHSLDAVL